MAVNAALQTRTPGTMQGVLLLLPITMAVMGLVVLAPVLPAHAGGVPARFRGSSTWYRWRSRRQHSALPCSRQLPA